jgi:hypothetical protein
LLQAQVIQFVSSEEDRMLQKINTGLLLVAIVLLALIAYLQFHATENGRFTPLGDTQQFGFDTKTGQVCIAWPELGDENRDKTPVCRDLARK